MSSRITELLISAVNPYFWHIHIVILSVTTQSSWPWVRAQHNNNKQLCGSAPFSAAAPNQHLISCSSLAAREDTTRRYFTPRSTTTTFLELKHNCGLGVCELQLAPRKVVFPLSYENDSLNLHAWRKHPSNWQLWYFLLLHDSKFTCPASVCQSTTEVRTHCPLQTDWNQSHFNLFVLVFVKHGLRKLLEM